MNREILINRIITIGCRMYDKGLITATDGNISVRLSDKLLLITASGVCKGDLIPDDIVECDYNGVSLSGKPVSSEIAVHLAAYRIRPDVNAVVHSHPPYAVALSLAGMDLTEPLLPEVLIALGSVPVTRFAPPSSAAGGEVVGELIGQHSALILDRHGAVTVGDDLWTAYWRLERLEYAAKVLLFAHSTGNIKQLTEEEILSSVGARPVSPYLMETPVSPYLMGSPHPSAAELFSSYTPLCFTLPPRKF